jgi:hypothetical protein
MDAHPQPADQPAPYVARTPEDLLATVPLVLGFTPEESVVMLTFGAPRCFHARIEMPTLVEEVMPMIESLVEPALRHGVRRVVLLGFHLVGAPAHARSYPAEEFVAEVEACGLRVDARFGSYELHPANEEYAVWVLSADDAAAPSTELGRAFRD